MLPAVGLTNGDVHVEDEFFQRSSPLHLADPLTGEFHKRYEVARACKLEKWAGGQPVFAR